ncbi:MAG TPA: hypothetical protein VH395_14385 [Jatrophihabitantaceae bacterium]|jgi:hypothetical protein
MRITCSDEAAEHMWARHEVTSLHAFEAVTDVDAVVQSPDRASKSGLTDRVIGYSPTGLVVLCVIALRVDADYELVNAWPANATYRRIYREGA